MRKDARQNALLTILVVSCAVVLAGCANLPATTLYTYGDHATRILDLLMIVFWMAVAVFVIVQGALVYTVFRFRSKQDVTALPKQLHGNTKIEIAWTIAPAIVVLIIAVLTFRTQAANSYMPPEAVKIRAVAHQWWFEFQYFDQDGVSLQTPITVDEKNQPVITTATDLYVPVGVPITIQLDAADVMHNFWIPKIAGKTYMIPGKSNFLTFTVKEPGIYKAFCAEFCGEAHAQMHFRLIGLDAAEFAKWKTNISTIPEAKTGTVQVLGLTGDIARGAALFADAKKQCATCHIISGTAAKGKIGPNLTYVGSRTALGGAILPYSVDNLGKWLHESSAIKQGNLMGRVIKKGYLTDQEVADLAAYLDSMKLSVALPAEK
jgi:cytochrome c oxidase subunit 2